MSRISEIIDQRIVELKKIIKEKSKELNIAPQGTLHVSESGNRVQYYLKDNASEKKKRYLKNDEKQVVQALCQKDYDQKVLHTAQKELLQLERVLNKYPSETYEDIYQNLSDARKKYVEPILFPDEIFVANWEQAEFPKKDFQEDDPEYFTDKGERVRSKTEILIANALNKHNIPYRYECPLYLSGFGNVHPDFTVLSVRLRKEFYWEHMGMMDNPNYVEKAMNKISLYEKNNIFPGDALILTHESSKYPINSQIIEKMIWRYLK